ncbi:hypothetical protein [Pedobacter rhizosphaerae]|uniref:Uncharacterized protein n=1 Tax=Pedobacter rhizosphaerae TaxID=390241 RepID=A0A1H9T310_9SPHI|nr:hypothetical protein [Pedobacter rhizosphaerae]SER91521.1 hypothetical protein SAMN04488023_12066 [Pedobacter rhizosphaerae]
MTDHKQQAIALLKRGLETIQDRAYTEIAEIPTENSDDFQVKYSFVHDDLEGLFTVIGKTATGGSDQRKPRFALSAEFAEDSRHFGSVAAKGQVDKDLASSERYLNEHIQKHPN